MNILIVDDEKVTCLILKKALEKFGHLVKQASSGEEALDILKHHQISIVITDWMMPEMDGLELCNKIRNLDKPGYIYVILLTMRDSKKDKLESLSAGIDDILTKPLDIHELNARLVVAQRIIEMEGDLRETASELLYSKKKLESTNLLLQHASKRFQALFNGLPVPCFTTDKDGRIYEWNEACENLYGVPNYQATGQIIWDLICDPDEIEGYKNNHSKIFEGKTVEEYERIDLDINKIKKNVLCQMIPLRSEDHTILAAIVANLDITDRKRMEKKLEELASTDALTGLYNRRCMWEKLEENVLNSVRYGTSLSVIILDIDKFKELNDTFGHPEGDKVLKIVSELLISNARTNDVITRYGGEEFVVVLPQTDVTGAMVIAERLRVAIEEYHWERKKITSSFGVATFDKNSLTANVLIDNADKALYYSKKTGRNRVTHIDDLNSNAA